MNPRVARIGGSLIREIAAKRRPGSIDLGLGEPSLRPNPAHLEAAMRYVAERGIRYTVNAGDPQLRARIAGHYGYPWLGAAENVCVTTGSQEATYVVIKTLLDPGKDELLVVEPAFPSYAKMAALEGVAVQSVAMRESDGFAYDPERILDAVGKRTRAVVVCSPCNPTARVISREAVAHLAEGLLRRGGEPVWVIHDEVYREQTYLEDAGYFAAVYPHTIVTNSVSKSNALTGLRLGWAMTPAELAPSIVKVHAWVTSCADTFAQQVALHIFEEPGALREHAEWYGLQRSAVVDALRESGLQFIAPEGSFYACVRLPEGVSSLQAAHALADEREVIAIPGIAFGASFDAWLRLSWVAPVERVREGIARIADYCGAAPHATRSS
ncbi:MAG: pyridoxal phosphate-dependent aminotransferase [Vulcanimicrobiaceae bacterium]